jgi:ElaB/YqjD/DUF883 family membrane-anchored ribosome-binding protein
VATLFARLDVALDGNDVTVQVEGHAAALTGIGGTLSSVLENPPGAVADLSQALGSLPLPDLDVGGLRLASVYEDLRDALPTDLSGLLEAVISGLQTLQATASEQIAGVVGAALESVTALRALAELDLRCLDPRAPAAPETPGGTPPASPGASPGAGDGDAEPSGAAAAQAGVERTNAVLDMLPSPLDVRGFMTFVHGLLAIPQRATLLPHSVPALDAVKDPLDTLMTWDGMTGEQIRSDFAATLTAAGDLVRSSFGAALDGLVTDLEAATDVIPVSDLTNIATGLSTHLEALASAVSAGDVSDTEATVSEMEELLDQYAVVRAAIPLANLDTLPRRVAGRAVELERRATLAESALPEASGGAGLVEMLSGFLNQDASAENIADLRDVISAQIAWLQDLIDKIDVSALQEPIEQIAQGAQGAVDALDAALVDVTLQIQELFGSVRDLIAEVDLAELRSQTEQAMQEFRQDLTAHLNAFFEPARAAVAAVVEQIGETADQFDPEQVVDALRGAVEAVAGVLEDPEVAAAIAEIRGVVEGAKDGLEQLSFAPVIDPVVEAIDEVAEILRTIDTSLLPTPAQLALQAALAILPEDLTPVTDPIALEFGALIDAGPLPLLEGVRAQPDRLLESIRRFEPAALIGSALSEPLEAVLGQLESFRPSSLLEPVAAQFDDLKQRLAEDAAPGRLLQPLEPPFAQLLQSLDMLRPEDVVAPLEQTISEVINSVLEASPADEILEQTGEILGRIQMVGGVLSGVVDTVVRIRDLLAGFADPAAQLEAWIDSILGKVEPLPDDGSIAAALSALESALDAARGTAFTTRIDTALNPLTAALGTLAPQQRLTAIIHAHRAVSPTALAALPDSPEKTAIAEVLERSNPMQAEFARPYRALDVLRRDLAASRASLGVGLQNWDQRHHGAGSAFGKLRGLEPVPAQLAQQAREALNDRFVRPVSGLLAMAGPLQRVLDGVVGELQLLSASVEAKTAALVEGPGSLEGIRNALEQFVERLRGLDLAFLTDSVTELFDDVRSELSAIDPASLREAVDEAFAELLDGLSVEQVLPAAELQAVDLAYEEIIEKLQALDPEALVVDVVQPEFEATLLPLLESFDLSRLLEILVERLRALDDELRVELGRVNDAYKALRDAVPPLGISIDIDIDVDIDVPF